MIREIGHAFELRRGWVSHHIPHMVEKLGYIYAAATQELRTSKKVVTIDNYVFISERALVTGAAFHESDES